MSNKMTALYARSAANNTEHISQQMNDLVTSAHNEHFTNLCHFTDDGYSAYDYNRPGFKHLWAAMQAGEISTIIVKDISALPEILWRSRPSLIRFGRGTSGSLLSRRRSTSSRCTSMMMTTGWTMN